MKPMFASGNRRRPARFLCGLIVAGSVTPLANAAVVADYGADLQAVNPKSGWSYLWNANGPIGNAANYVPLMATPSGSEYFENRPYYTADGSPALPRSDPGAFAYIGLAGLGGFLAPGGHPGRGFGQDSLATERYVIAAYQLNMAGPTSIRGILNLPTHAETGNHLRVFVNNTDTLFDLQVPAFTSKDFNLGLGSLQASNTIYVAIGANRTDAQSGFYLDFEIDVAVVPEPATLGLFGLSAVFVVAGRFRKKAKMRRMV